VQLATLVSTVLLRAPLHHHSPQHFKAQNNALYRQRPFYSKDVASADWQKYTWLNGSLLLGNSISKVPRNATRLHTIGWRTLVETALYYWIIPFPETRQRLNSWRGNAANTTKSAIFPPDIWMFSNTRDKLSKSKLAVLAHRLVTEIEQVTGGHFPVQVSLVCVCVCVCALPR